MIKNLVHSAVMLAVLVTGGTLCAQMSQTPYQPSPGPRAVPPSPEQRLQRMTQQLGLTDAQQQQIKPLLESESQQMQALQQDASISQPDKWPKMKQIRQSTTDQIKPILTSDQQKKFDEMQAQHPHKSFQVHTTDNPPQSPPKQ